MMPEPLTAEGFMNFVRLPVAPIGTDIVVSDDEGERTTDGLQMGTALTDAEPTGTVLTPEENGRCCSAVETEPEEF